MYWINFGLALAFWIALMLWLITKARRVGRCVGCQGTGVYGPAGRLCALCRGTGRELPPGPTWRMETGKGGRLWWTCSNGTRVCGLCFDTGVVVDHIAGYKSGPCPECSRPGGFVRPMGVRQVDEHPFAGDTR